MYLFSKDVITFCKLNNLDKQSENLKTLDASIELAKTHLKKIFQQIQNFIEMNQIVASGPFLQVFLEEVYFNFY